MTTTKDAPGEMGCEHLRQVLDQFGNARECIECGADVVRINLDLRTELAAVKARLEEGERLVARNAPRGV